MAELQYIITYTDQYTQTFENKSYIISTKTPH